VTPSAIRHPPFAIIFPLCYHARARGASTAT
jgi:hypothetical protein